MKKSFATLSCLTTVSLVLGMAQPAMAAAAAAASKTVTAGYCAVPGIDVIPCSFNSSDAICQGLGTDEEISGVVACVAACKAGCSDTCILEGISGCEWTTLVF